MQHCRSHLLHLRIFFLCSSHQHGLSRSLLGFFPFLNLGFRRFIPVPSPGCRPKTLVPRFYSSSTDFTHTATCAPIAATDLSRQSVYHTSYFVSLYATARMLLLYTHNVNYARPQIHSYTPSVSLFQVPQCYHVDISPSGFADGFRSSIGPAVFHIINMTRHVPYAHHVLSWVIERACTCQ